MTYQPTKEELEELGFLSASAHEVFFPFWDWGGIECLNLRSFWVTKDRYSDENTSTRIYPQSIEDLKSLIRILTPQ